MSLGFEGLSGDAIPLCADHHAESERGGDEDVGLVGVGVELDGLALERHGQREAVVRVAVKQLVVICIGNV